MYQELFQLSLAITLLSTVIKIVIKEDESVVKESAEKKKSLITKPGVVRSL